VSLPAARRLTVVLSCFVIFALHFGLQAKEADQPSGWVLDSIHVDEAPDLAGFRESGWHTVLHVDLDLEAGDLVRILGEQQFTEAERVATLLTTQIFAGDAPAGIAASQRVKRGDGENHHITFRGFGTFVAGSSGTFHISYRARMSEVTRIDIDQPRFGGLTVRRFRPAEAASDPGTEAGLHLAELVSSPVASPGFMIAHRATPFLSGRLRIPYRGQDTWALLSTQNVYEWNPHGASAEVIVDQLAFKRPRALYRMGENVTASLRSLALSLSPAVAVGENGLDLELTSYIGNGSGVTGLGPGHGHLQALVFAKSAPGSMILRDLEEWSLPAETQSSAGDAGRQLLVSQEAALESPSVISVQAATNVGLERAGKFPGSCRQRPVLERRETDLSWARVAAGSWNSRSVSPRDPYALLTNNYAFAISEPGNYRVICEFQTLGEDLSVVIPAGQASLMVERYGSTQPSQSPPNQP
jgi:hypothetical protein